VEQNILHAYIFLTLVTILIAFDVINTNPGIGVFFLKSGYWCVCLYAFHVLPIRCILSDCVDPVMLTLRLLSI
jgi:hypothetical protein